MKSLLSCMVIVPSKSVKKMYLGFSKGHFMAVKSLAEDDILKGRVLVPTNQSKRPRCW